jgi:hypothetical protein
LKRSFSQLLSRANRRFTKTGSGQRRKEARKWGIVSYSYATTPDELEYMAARGAAYDAAPSLETGPMMLQGNG